MKKIPLRNHKKEVIAFTKVDDEDFEDINKKSWYLTDQGYAKSRVFPKLQKSYLVLLHRIIMKAKKGEMIDHINQDRLDNRKINLRFCDKKTNGANMKKHKDNTSGYKGVYFEKTNKKWRGKITKQGKQFFTKSFLLKEDAVKEYRKLSIKIYGEFSPLK